MALGMARAVWSYRGFVLGSVQREFQTRYRNSLFGAAWTILNPLSMIIVYTVIFSQLMQARLPGVSRVDVLTRLFRDPALRRGAIDIAELPPHDGQAPAWGRRSPFSTPGRRSM